MAAGLTQPSDPNDSSKKGCHSSLNHVTGSMQEELANNQHALETTAMEQPSYVMSYVEPIVPVVHSLLASSIPYQDVERFRSSHAGTKPATSVHLVPNIVVEHVSLLSADSHMPPQRLGDIPPLRFSLSELSSAVQSASVSRQSRALSDSSLRDLEKSLYSTSSHCIKRLGYLSDSLDSSTISLDGALVTDIPQTSTKAGTRQSSVPTIAESKDSMTMPLDENRLSVPSVKTAIVQPTQGFLSSPRFGGPQRSPKAYWLRRHSDSNLESGPEESSGLRVEPYPICSHSTGNSFMASVMPVCGPSSSTISCDFSDVELEDKLLNIESSMSLHQLRVARQSMEHSSYCSTLAAEQKCHQSSRVLAESESLIQSQLKAISLVNDTAITYQESFKRSNQKEVVSEDHKVGSFREFDESTVLAKKPSSLVRSAVIMEKQVMAEKRLKLKKYLQTRYQLGLHDSVLPSSESDDVFLDRFVSPGPFTPLTQHANETTALDLVIKNAKPRSDSTAECQLLGSSSTSYAMSGRVNRMSSNSHSSNFMQCHMPLSDDSSNKRMKARLDDNFSIKEERRSPCAIPKGTSVFVFPPPAVMRFEELCLGSPHYMHLSHSHESSTMTSSPQRNSDSSTACGIASSIDCNSRPTVVSVSECVGKHRELDGHATVPMDFSFSTVVSDIVSDSSVLGKSSYKIAQIPATSITNVLLEPSSEHGRAVQTSSTASVQGMPESFVCPLCSVAFQSCGNLTDHMAVHVTDSSSPAESATGLEACTGSSKPVHLCPICQRTFSRGDMLTRHVRLHTGVRPYECTLCSQVFSRSDHLTTHQRTHTGEKPYRCPVCAYAAPRRDMVTRHVRIHETQSGAAAAAYARRGRKAVAVGRGQVTDVAAVSRKHPFIQDTMNPVCSNRRLHGKPEYAIQPPWSHSSVVFDEVCSGAFNERRESYIESADCSRSSMPVTCRAWSTASAESFESFPGSHTRGPSMSSVTADSPDVFLHHSRHFQWGLEGPVRVSSSLSKGTVAEEIAGVAPTFQMCSVKTSPLYRDHGSDGDAN